MKFRFWKTKDKGERIKDETRVLSSDVRSYEIGERVLYQRELTLRAMQRIAAMKDGGFDLDKLKKDPSGKLLFDLCADPKAVRNVLSAVLTDEQGYPADLTEAEYDAITLNQMGVIVDDFFTLNPGLTDLLGHLLIASLNSESVRENPNGTAPISGSTSAL